MGNVNTQDESDVNCKDDIENTPLHYACKEGFSIITEFLIGRNANVNSTGEDKNTPLHYACRYGHTNIANMLIQHGAIINCENSDKITPLHFACARRNADIAKILLEHGANVNCTDICYRSAEKYLNYVKNEDGDYICEVVTNVMSEGGATPLHVACAYGHVDVTKILIEHGAIVNCEDKRKQTPLYLACGNGHADKAKILIDNNATVNCKNIYKDTPLHVACKYGFTDVVRLLFDNTLYLHTLNELYNLPIHESSDTEIKNVDVIKLVFTHTSVNSPDKYDLTPLHLASSSGNIEIVKMLLELGADINLADKKSGSLPIHYACRTDKNNIDIIKFYVIYLNVDINCADRGGRTLLHVASECGIIDNVKFLVEHGADINIADVSGKLPIHSAVNYKTCNYDLIKFYLDLKIDINRANEKDGKTLLHIASEFRGIKIIKFLLKHKADVSIADCRGETALHKVVQAYKVVEGGLLKIVEPEIKKMLEILIDHGADINAKNKSGLSVLDLAKDKKFNEVTLYLEFLIKLRQ